jgi:hypothetical protein
MSVDGCPGHDTGGCEPLLSINLFGGFHYLFASYFSSPIFIPATVIP